jgi:subtilisin-like proprotein convertase family protein
MQPTFTQKIIGSFRIKILAMALILISYAGVSYSQVLINEGFDIVDPLPAGWATQNNSNPIGVIGWFQPDGSVFPGNSGDPTSFAAVNYQSGGDIATINDWLITPNIPLKNGDIFTFYTRTVAGSPVFPDRLQVRMSTNGASTDVGATETSVGDFTTLLLDINPTYSTTIYPVAWTKYTVTISGVGPGASGRLAFRYFVENGGPFGDNSNYLGVDDVVYTTFAPCTATPTPGATISSVPTVCPGNNFTLSLENPPAATGITFQWQSSSTLAGPYTDIPGATSLTLLTTQAAATYYRANVTCDASVTTGTSTPVQVLETPSSGCYCVPPPEPGACDFGDEILNVTIGTLNNSSSGCNGLTYTNYPSSTATTELVSGGANPMSVDVGPGGFDFVGVWIDYDHSGTFELSEFTDLTNAVGNPGGTVTGTIVIPASALAGNTRMRVRIGFGFDFTGTDACDGSFFGYGETEDYTVSIVPCVQGVFTTQPINTSAACGSDASFIVEASGSLITYQWEQRVSPTAPWTFVTDGGIYSGATTSTLTLTGVSDSINKYQYRALINGACTATDFSNIALLTVTPLIALVSPEAPTVCTGSIQALSITNAASAPPSTTSTFSSGPISLIVPDANLTGANSTIAVSGIPTGGVITGISVKFTLPHTYAGDLDIVLKAPNGSIFNLDYFLSTTGGPGPTTGFTNTVISSTGTAELSSGNDPWTGTFAPDGIVTIITGNPPSGPTGFTPTVATFAGLYSVPNGNWTLALYDAFTGDEGTLTSWSMDISYTTPDFEKGVWSPIAGLFTDAAATVPYTGNPVTTVYVKPTVNAEYSVVLTTASCTSAPTVVPVTVTAPITSLSNPTNKDGCIDGSVSFSAEAVSAGPVTYQWQELTTDVGAVFTDIPGETSSTLTIEGLTLDMDGYQYRIIAKAGGCGSDTSAAAILSMFDLPVVTIAAASPSLLLTPGLTNPVTATSTPAGASYTWTLNGSIVSGATGSVIPVDIDGIGTYNATVTDIHGCVNTSNDLFIGFASSDRLWIYPNPSTGVFQVRLYGLGSPNEKRRVSVYNSAGGLIVEKIFTLDNTTNPYQKMEFDLNKAAPGIYLVKVANEYSKKIVSGFVIVGR